MDVITAHQYGFNNVIASMGTSITDKQVNAIKRLTKNMVLALDADTAGEEAMLRCVDYENSLDAEVKVLILPGGQDPDDVVREDARTWQRLLDEALPVIDYTFNMVTSKLDMTTAANKSLVVDRLLPIIAEIEDDIRRDHYLNKLSRLTGISYRNLEATLKNYRTRRKTRKPRQETITAIARPLLSHPAEEYCLALLLKHPELKSKDGSLLPEYFENSENREIFVVWQQADDLSALKEKLDPALWEHLDSLVNRNILATRIEERYNKYVLRLREEYLRGLERKKAAALTLEAETGGTAAELAKLKEQGIEVSDELRKVFTQKAKRGQSKGDKE